MGDMVTPSSSPESVDSLFELWLDAFEQGGEDFDTFVARHTAQAPELRRLHGAWRKLCAAMPESAATGAGVPRGPKDLPQERRSGAGTAGAGRLDASLAGATLTDGSMAEGRQPQASASDDARTEFRVGALIGDYRLVQQLGIGGMGQVWEAEQVSLGRRVALKMLRPGRGFLGGERLLHEARAAGRINHPGIVPVFAAGEASGVHFVVQQIVGDGTTLADLIERRRTRGEPSALRLAALFIDIAEALQAAHEQGILHRDLKPRNILIDPDGRPRVSDFGLALRLGEIASHSLVGTCAYMSPEQAEGGASLDARSDVFSLGAVLYEALTLERAFDGDSITDVLAAVRDERPLNPARRARDVPEDLAAVCLKALEKDPDARYQDMRALVGDLRRLLAHEPVLARRPSAAGRAWRWSRRHPGRAVGLLLGGLSLVIVASMLVRESSLRREAESRTVEARAQGYLANLRAAAAHMQRGNPVEALQRLEACPPELRGWEWRHAKLLVNSAVTLLPGHEGGTTAVVISPDGRRVITGAADSVVRSWDASGARGGAFGAGLGTIEVLALSEDGRRLAIAGAEGDVQIRDAQRDTLLGVIPGDGSAWAAVALNADGSRVVACGRDGRVLLWDSGVVTLLPGSPPEVAGIASAALSADGSTLVTGSPYGVVTLWSLSGELLPFALNDYERGPAVVAVSKDGQIVAAGMPDGSVRVWGAPDWVLRDRLEAHERPVTKLALSADGRWAASASAGDEPVVLYDLDAPAATPTRAATDPAELSGAAPSEAQPVASAEEPSAPTQDTTPAPTLAPADPPVVFDAGSAGVADLAADAAAEVAVALPLRGAVVGVFAGHGGRIASLGLSADGRRVVSGCMDGTAYVWDRLGAGPVHELSGPGPRPHSLSISTDGRVVAWSSSLAARATVWRDGATSVLELGPGNLGAVALDADGALLAAGRTDGTVQLIELATGRRLPELRAGNDGIEALALVEHGAVLLAAVGATLVRLDVASGARSVLAGHTAPITGLAVSADGRRAATASVDGSVRLWDVPAGTGVVVERGEPFDDNVIALDGPGRQLAVALAAGGTIRIYDTATLAPQGEITDLESGVPCLAFSRDGSRLFTAAYNGKLLRVWDPHLAENLIDFEPGGAGTSALAFAAGEVFSVGTDGRIVVRESGEN